MQLNTQRGLRSLEFASDSTLRKLENNSTTSQTTVDLAVGVKAVVNAAALLLVEDDLERLAAVLLGAGTLADDLNGVDEVVKDSIVDGRQGAGTGALLLLVGAGVDGALGLRKDAALSNEEDVAVGELLLKLAGQAIGVVSLALFRWSFVCGCGVQWIAVGADCNCLNVFLGNGEHTAAGSCGSSGGEERGRRQ